MKAHPIVDIEIFLHGSTTEVLVNGGPVFENRRQFPMSASITANLWIVPGENVLSAHLGPLPGNASIDPAAALRVAVFVRDRDARDAPGEKLGEWEFRPSGQTQETQSHTEESRIFSLEVPFPEWPWRRLAVLKDSPSLREKLVAEISRFHRLLETRDLDGVLQTVAPRDRDVAIAYYRVPSERSAQSRREWSAILDDSGFVLQPLDLDGAHVRLFGGGRLARLETPKGQSPLRYADPEKGLNRFLTMLYAGSPDGSLMLIR